MSAPKPPSLAAALADPLYSMRQQKRWLEGQIEQLQLQLRDLEIEERAAMKRLEEQKP